MKLTNQDIINALNNNEYKNAEIAEYANEIIRAFHKAEQASIQAGKGGFCWRFNKSQTFWSGRNWIIVAREVKKHL
jgi:hypothetical protein